jgi:hypothetical protein
VTHLEALPFAVRASLESPQFDFYACVGAKSAEV